MMIHRMYGLTGRELEEVLQKRGINFMGERLLRQRLEAFGYNPDTLPEMTQCLNCNGEEKFYRNFRMDDELWEVGCTCGNNPAIHGNLIVAINKFNKRNGG